MSSPIGPIPERSPLPSFDLFFLADKALNEFLRATDQTDVDDKIWSVMQSINDKTLLNMDIEQRKKLSGLLETSIEACYRDTPTSPKLRTLEGLLEKVQNSLSVIVQEALLRQKLNGRFGRLTVEELREIVLVQRRAAKEGKEPSGQDILSNLSPPERKLYDLLFRVYELRARLQAKEPVAPRPGDDLEYMQTLYEEACADLTPEQRTGFAAHLYNALTAGYSDNPNAPEREILEDFFETVQNSLPLGDQVESLRQKLDGRFGSLTPEELREIVLVQRRAGQEDADEASKTELRQKILAQLDGVEKETCDLLFRGYELRDRLQQAQDLTSDDIDYMRSLYQAAIYSAETLEEIKEKLSSPSPEKDAIPLEARSFTIPDRGALLANMYYDIKKLIPKETSDSLDLRPEEVRQWERVREKSLPREIRETSALRQIWDRILLGKDYGPELDDVWASLRSKSWTIVKTGFGWIGGALRGVFGRVSELFRGIAFRFSKEAALKKAFDQQASTDENFRIANQIISRAMSGKPPKPCPLEEQDLVKKFTLYLDFISLHNTTRSHLQKVITAMINNADDRSWRAMNEALHTFFKKNPERAKVKADIVRSMSGQIQQALQHPNKNDVGLALYRAERLIPLRSSETIPSQYFDNFVDTLFQSQGVKFQATARHPAYAEANLDVPSATTDSIVSTYNRVSSIQIGDLVVEGPATSGHEKEGLARAKHYHERLTAYLTEKGVKNPKRVAYELLLRCCGDIGFTHFNYGIVAQLTGVNSLYNVNVQGDPRPQVYFFVQANGTCVAEQITPIRHIRVEESDEEKKRETLVDEWFKLDPANIEDQWVETVVTKPSTTQSVETVDKAPPPISEVE